MIETYPWLSVALASAVASAATWAVCRWRFTRQLAAAAERIDKLDKARSFTSQQLMQARKQIEKLQVDMAARANPSVARRTSVPIHTTRSEAMRRGAQNFHSPDEPATGFADTQTME